MASNKHSKIKNTGILFELLLRQIASEILSNQHNATKDILQEFFNPKTELNKELYLYRTLLKDKFKDTKQAESFIETVVEQRRKLDAFKLKKEKYELVKKLTEEYSNLSDFFKTRIQDYKLYASIFKLFEFALGKNIKPADVITSKFSLMEHITLQSSAPTTIKSEIQDEYKKLDKDLRILAYKILIERFNKKYVDLNSDQKSLLSEYINNISNSTKLKAFVDTKVPVIKKELTSLLPSIKDEVVKIKVQEIREQLDNFMKGTVISDDQIMLLMRYYQLIDEIKKVG